MLWWLLQGLQKSVEGRLGEHVHLVDDVHFVFARLWRNTHLIYKASDIIHRIIGSRIELKNIEGEILILPFGTILVYFFGQDSGTSCFTNAPWATK